MLRLTFKTPDVLSYATDDETLRQKLSKWIEYEEYVTLEYDEDKDTIRVVPV